MPLFPAYAQQLIFFNLNKSTDDYKLEALHGIKKQSPKVQCHLIINDIAQRSCSRIFLYHASERLCRFTLRF